MCRALSNKPGKPAEAFFRKDNLPEGMASWFKGKVYPCACGKKMWFAAPGLKPAEVVIFDGVIKFDRKAPMGERFTAK